MGWGHHDSDDAASVAVVELIHAGESYIATDAGGHMLPRLLVWYWIRAWAFWPDISELVLVDRAHLFSTGMASFVPDPRHWSHYSRWNDTPVHVRDDRPWFKTMIA